MNKLETQVAKNRYNEGKESTLARCETHVGSYVIFLKKGGGGGGEERKPNSRGLAGQLTEVLLRWQPGKALHELGVTEHCTLKGRNQERGLCLHTGAHSEEAENSPYLQSLSRSSQFRHPRGTYFTGQANALPILVKQPWAECAPGRGPSLSLTRSPSSWGHHP